MKYVFKGIILTLDFALVYVAVLSMVLGARENANLCAMIALSGMAQAALVAVI